jgi:hypothetical protein
MTAAFLRALAIGVPAGAACAWLGTPLPWLIGSLLACAAARVGGAPIACPVPVRSAGQWAIGTALGLYFTPEVVGRLLWFAPQVLAGVLWALAVGSATAWALRRYAAMDPPTAFFAGAVGSASEMAVQGERHGGSVETVAAVHSLRIMMVVVIVPFAYQWLGLHGSDAYEPAAREVHWGGLALLVAATVAGSLALRAANSPNAWVIGPLLVAGGITAGGVVLTALPGWIVSGGQLFIGVALGTRFTPEFYRKAPRTLGVAAASTLVSILASALFGALLAAWAGVPVATMVLATAPGGIAEMSLTAKLLQLGVPVVTLFHVARMVAMVLLAGQVYRWFARRQGWVRDLHAVRSRRGGDDDD